MSRTLNTASLFPSTLFSPWWKLVCFGLLFLTSSGCVTVKTGDSKTMEWAGILTQ